MARAFCRDGHWKALTFIANLRHEGIVAPCVLDGLIDAESFNAWVERFLIPALKPGSIVVFDNLGSHKASHVRKLLKTAGCHISIAPDLGDQGLITATRRQT